VSLFYYVPLVYVRALVTASINLKAVAKLHFNCEKTGRMFRFREYFYMGSQQCHDSNMSEKAEEHKWPAMQSTKAALEVLGAEAMSE
jgi:hypothetical protein